MPVNWLSEGASTIKGECIEGELWNSFQFDESDWWRISTNRRLLSGAGKGSGKKERKEKQAMAMQWLMQDRKDG